MNYDEIKSMNAPTVTLTLPVDQAVKFIGEGNAILTINETPYKKINFIKLVRVITLYLEGEMWGLVRVKEFSEGKPEIVLLKLANVLKEVCTEMGGAWTLHA